MINVNEVKQYAEFLAKKNQSGGTFTPNEYNQALAFTARDMVRKYIGTPEQYQPGNPQPQISYELTQVVREYLSDLKPKELLQVTNGYLTRPSDYLYFSALRYRYTTTTDNDIEGIIGDSPDCEPCDDDAQGTPTIQGEPPVKKLTTTVWKPIVLLSDAQFDWAVESEVRSPSMEFPIARMEAGGKFQILPAEIKEAELSYVRYPKKPFWNYNIVGGFAVYDAAGSQQIELPEICATEFLMTMLQYLGISIREPMLINWADRKKQTGQ